MSHIVQFLIVLIMQSAVTAQWVYGILDLIDDPSECDSRGIDPANITDLLAEFRVGLPEKVFLIINAWRTPPKCCCF